MMRRREGSAKIVAVIVLLLVAGGVAAGAWNYQRNVKIEGQEFRPFRGTTLEDLELLAEAYRSEVAGLNRRYTDSRRGQGRVRDHEYFGEQVDEFERVQRRGRRTRDLGAKVSTEEAALRDIEAEIARKKAEGSGMTRHLRRLLRF